MECCLELFLRAVWVFSLDPPQSIANAMDMRIHSYALLHSLSHVHVDHGYLHPHSRIGQQLLGSPRQTLFEDGVADLDYVLRLALVEVALVDQLHQFLLGDCGHGLGSEAVLFEPLNAFGGGLILGLDGEHEGDQGLIFLDLDGGLRISQSLTPHRIHWSQVYPPPRQYLFQSGLPHADSPLRPIFGVLLSLLDLQGLFVILADCISLGLLLEAGSLRRVSWLGEYANSSRSKSFCIINII